MTDRAELIAEMEFAAKVETMGERTGAVFRKVLDLLRAAAPFLRAPEGAKFTMGDRVCKVSGSSWQGPVCGFYTTALTPIGYCIESEREPNSVQNYPESALAAVDPARGAAEDYSAALRRLKAGEPMRRTEWRPNKWVQLAIPDGSLSYLEMKLSDGRAAPYTPSRCDQFGMDWINADKLVALQPKERGDD